MIKINDKFIPVLCLVFGLFLGFGIEYWHTEKYMAQVKTRMTGLRLIEDSQTEMKLLTGLIQSINGRTLTIALQSPKFPFDDPSLDERLITIDDSTTITVESVKDPAIAAKETAEWMDKLSSLKPGETGGEIISPPPLSEKKPGTPSSLTVGKLISVTTVDNIKTKKSFVAQSVNVINLSWFGPSLKPGSTEQGKTDQ